MKINHFVFVILIGLYTNPGIVAQTTQTYQFTGSPQVFTVPNCVGTVTMIVRGAQGASNSSTTTIGGYGGLTQGVITVTPGTNLYIFVGGTNGYNGGGAFGVSSCVSARGGNGGGGSDVRLNGLSLADRIIVAGGGGGGGGDRKMSCGRGTGGGGGGGYYGGGGGAGWGTVTVPLGGSQVAGGAGGLSSLVANYGSPGMLGTGGPGGGEVISGQAANANANNGGSGGGLTGANGIWVTPYTGQSGAGGSGFVHPSLTNTSIVTGTNSGNGSVTIIYNVFSGPPYISVSPSSIAICNGGSAVFSASGLVSYTWSTGSNNASVSVNPPFTTSYSVAGTNALGCVTSSVLNVIVNQPPQLTVTGSTNQVCSGNPVTLSAFGATTYTWSSGVVNGVTFSPTTTATYFVTGQNACGTGNASITVTVHQRPVISVNSGSVCAGNAFTIIPTGAQTYSYSSGSSIVFPSVSANYSVIGASPQGCVSQNVAISSVLVAQPPVISVSSGSICQGAQFFINPQGAFTYTISGGSSTVSPVVSTNYSVTGTSQAGCVSPVAAISQVIVHSAPVVAANSGSVCAGNIFVINPTGAGTYTISGGTFSVSPQVTTVYTITGSSTQGCLSSNIASATVNVLPSPSITVNSGTVCAGQSFTLLPSGAQTYSYSGGSAVVSPPTTTQYTVTGISAAGCLSPPVIANVFVNSLPNIVIGGPTGVCAGYPATLTAAGATSYQWNTGETSAVIVVTPQVSTPYTVTGTDQNGCMNSTQKLLTAFSLPLLSISGNTNICHGMNTSLLAGGAAITYTWNTGATGNLLSVSPSVTTVYSVSGTDLNNCKGSKTATVVVGSGPPVTAHASKTVVCKGDLLTLYGGGGISYTWTTGPGNNIPFTPTATATYTVAGTTSANCVSQATVEVILEPLPVISLAITRDSICLGEPITVAASGANIYFWSTGGIGPSISLVPTGSTTYSVSGISANGCTGKNSISVHVSDCGATGLQEKIYQGNVMIFPKPAHDRLNIISTETDKGEVIIMNELSQVIIQTSFNGDLSLDISEVPAGLYFVVLKLNGDLLLRKKIIIGDR